MHTKKLIFLAVFVLAGCKEAAVSPPLVARVEDVHDSYFGTQVVDPYRWMETPGSRELADWMKAQNEYTRATFALPKLAAARQALFERIRTLQSGVDSTHALSRVGDRYFFFETPADGKTTRLMVRGVAGGQKRLLADPADLSSAGARASVDTYIPSNDGARVVISVAHGGAEDWTLRVVDTASGKLLPDVIPRIASPIAAWTADSKGFYYSRLHDFPPDAPSTTKYDNLRIYFHELGAPVAKDYPVFGPGVDPAVDVPAQAGFPGIATTRDGRYLIASHARGTDVAQAFWLRDLHSKNPRWRQVISYNDKVSTIDIIGNWIYVIRQDGAPNGRAVRFDVDKDTLAQAQEIVPPSEAVISIGSGGLVPTKDALYILGLRNGQSVLRRMAYSGGAIEEVKLPGEGLVSDLAADEGIDGFTFALQSPSLAPRIFRYEPAGERFVDTGLQAADAADFSNIETRRVEVPSTGAVMVPVTITAPKKLRLDGSNPVLLTVYGSYGVVISRKYTAADLAWYERGGVIAFVHARGGGEKGEAWHEAGRRTNKQHTVDDVIAAARWLIEHGWTSPDRLAVAGKSAGGIPVTGAITQHPELFRAALVRVGVTDILRIEQSAGGPANVMEYGSSKNEAEFHAINALNPYGRVQKDVAYPAVLLETGINDPRVPPWQLAKMTARLQAATSSSRPILLRVDYDGGHGLGSDKLQVAEQLADEYAFLGWQMGMKVITR